MNVWCCIVEGKIAGQYSFDGGPLKGNFDLYFLNQRLNILLEDISLGTKLKMWFQHDVCPVHFTQN